MPQRRPPQHVKVFYRPIEAAIRWSQLTELEPLILAALGERGWPASHEFPQWPALHLNTERILDAMRHGELAYGARGMTTNDPSTLDGPALTVRHVDLKEWISRVYPEEKPAFLFERRRRQRRHRPATSWEIMPASQTELEAVTSRWHGAERQQRGNIDDATLSDRAERTYLNIIGGLLSLLLGESPSGQPYSSFRTQDAVISALVAHHGKSMGIAERTLQMKFARAKRLLSM